MTLTATDIFCGAGGESIGLAGAGIDVVLAANHWNRAIETHSANFPDAEHLCADVSNYDQQTMQAGNAVSSNVAHWIGRAVIAHLDAE